MDPNACLRRLLDAQDEGDYEEAGEAAADLEEWLLRGGFVPDISGLDRDDQITILITFCRSVVEGVG